MSMAAQRPMQSEIDISPQDCARSRVGMQMHLVAIAAALGYTPRTGPAGASPRCTPRAVVTSTLPAYVSPTKAAMIAEPAAVAAFAAMQSASLTLPDAVDAAVMCTSCFEETMTDWSSGALVAQYRLAKSGWSAGLSVGGAAVDASFASARHWFETASDSFKLGAWTLTRDVQNYRLLYDGGEVDPAFLALVASMPADDALDPANALTRPPTPFVVAAGEPLSFDVRLSSDSVVLQFQLNRRHAAP